MRAALHLLSLVDCYHKAPSNRAELVVTHMLACVILSDRREQRISLLMTIWCCEMRFFVASLLRMTKSWDGCGDVGNHQHEFV